MDETNILEYFKRRDEKALEECEANYGKLLRRIAYNILGSDEDAEECAQDALHKLWESSKSELIADPRSYLATVTRNNALTRLRASSREKRGGGEYTVAISELADCLPSKQNVEAEVEARELAKAIDRWVRTLSTDDRVLFVRRYRIGDPVSVLAEDMQIRPARVSQKLRSMREKLRKYLVKENYLE